MRQKIKKLFYNTFKKKLPYVIGLLFLLIEVTRRVLDPIKYDKLIKIITYPYFPINKIYNFIISLNYPVHIIFTILLLFAYGFIIGFIISFLIRYFKKSKK